MNPPISQLQPATFAEFEQETKRGNVVAVARTVSADAMNPVDAFVNVAGSARYAFLFESVEGGEGVAKYSFLGADPYMIVRGRGRRDDYRKRGRYRNASQVRDGLSSDATFSKTNWQAAATLVLLQAARSDTWVMEPQTGLSRRSTSMATVIPGTILRASIKATMRS